MRNLYERAHSIFMDKLEDYKHETKYPFPYDLANDIKEYKFNIPMMSLSIANDLSELINQLHSWHDNLVCWTIWNEVLKLFSGTEEWSIRHQYVEVIAYYCMLQPSATRERFGTIATTFLHHANLTLVTDYKDQLDQDQHGYLSRRKRDTQLNRIGKSHQSFEKFHNNLKRLDDKSFNQNSYNFRDLASHGIAPRFEQGETSLVKRSFIAWEDLVEQPDGSYLPVKHPTKKSVSYGIGGSQPLSFKDAYEACWQEYLKATQLLHSYQGLIKEILKLTPSHIPASPEK
jgi:hypothetical protein